MSTEKPKMAIATGTSEHRIPCSPIGCLITIFVSLLCWGIIAIAAYWLARSWSG